MLKYVCRLSVLICCALALLGCFLLCSTQAEAATYSGSCGTGVRWSYDTSIGILSISGSGQMNTYSTSSRPWADFNGVIQYIVVDEGVTNISDGAFSYSGVIRVTLPESLLSIGSNAFYDCDNLSNIFVRDSVTSIGYNAFFGCSKLKSFEMPANLTHIYGSAFSGCESLTSISLPEGLLSIGDRAFAGCTALTMTSPTLPESLRSIGKNAFYRCSALTEIEIPNGVTSIGSEAFSSCENLETVILPTENVSIGDSVFMYCRKLTSINLPAGMTAIPMSFFDTCQSLQSVNIPTTVTTIGTYAFYGCISLTGIEIPSGVTSIGRSAFNGCYALTDVYYDGTATDKAAIFIDEGNDSLTKATWYYVYGVLAYTIEDGQVTITDCDESVTGELVVPSTIEGYPVTTIGSQAFVGCSGLTSITLPNGVTQIANNAFAGCTGLKDVYYCGTEEQKTAITIGSYNDPLHNATWHYAEPAKLVFAGAAVVLHSDLGINFKVDSQLLKSGGYTSPYVVFSFGGKTLTVTNFTEADGKHVFKFTNIAPHQLGQEITATLYATQNGQLVEGETITYSVKDYCYNMLETCKPENDSEGKYGELRTLLVDLLHYGAASQGYVGEAGEAVDGALTETQLAWGTAGDPALSSITDPSYATVEAPQVVWKSANLLLRDSVKVRVKFAADSLEGLCLKVTVDGVEYEIAAGEILPAETDGLYYITFDRLNAAQLRQAIYFTAYKDGVAVSNTLRYSVESYACSYQSSPNAALSALVKAMIRYGNSAYAIIH